MWCWHEWEKWKVVEIMAEIRMTDPLTGRLLDKDERYQVGKCEIQRRECSRCAKSQLREVSS